MNGSIQQIIIWVLVIIASIVVESATTQLVAIWFMPAALIALIVAIFTDNITIQLIVFTLISLLSIIFLRKAVSKFLFRKPYEPTNTDLLIGKTAMVTEEINNDLEKGEVKISGKLWSARSEDGSVLPKDIKVTIVKIEGVKLICTAIK